MPNFIKNWKTTLLLPLIAVLVAACGGGGGDSSGSITSGTSASTFTITGSVGDGPVVNATVVATDSEGLTLLTTQSDSTANYSFVIDDTANFPVLLTATSGTDMITNAAPSFTMLSVILDKNATVANITPLSTIIVMIAMDMPGGLNAANISAAKAYVINKLNFGLDLSLIPDPITTPITASNVANMVKTSEATAEMIRRTQDTLTVSGISITEDSVIAALASDLSDGAIDGAGGTNSDSRIAATSNLITGQVLIEVLTNHIKVNGGDVTSLLDTAIQLTEPTAIQTTADVVISDEIITQTIAVLNAVQSMVTSTNLETFSTTLKTLGSGNSAANLDANLPSGVSTDINQAIALVTTATNAELDAINSAANAPITNQDTACTNTSSNITLATTNTNPTNYVWDTVAINKQYFIDRSFVITGAPLAYINSAMLRTANDDKALTSSSHITFDINAEAYVYIGYDIRIPTLPTWLSSWINTGDNIVTSDTTYLLYKKAFTAGTVTLGGNESGSHSMYIVLVTPTAGGTVNSCIPIAANDSVTTNQNSSVTINILANDSGLGATPITVSILSGSSNGTSTVQSNNTISYTPNNGFSGTDSFTYKIVDSNGSIATATVTIQVKCTSCAAATIVALSWAPNPSQDNALGYLVFFGQTSTTATQQILDVSSTTTGFVMSAPLVEFNAWNDLGLNIGDNACFRVKAYNSAGVSGFSSAVCSTL